MSDWSDLYTSTAVFNKPQSSVNSIGAPITRPVGFTTTGLLQPVAVQDTFDGNMSEAEETFVLFVDYSSDVIQVNSGWTVTIGSVEYTVIGKQDQAGYRDVVAVSLRRKQV